MSAVLDRELTHQEILPVIRGVALCILLAALDQTIIVPALPRMAARLGGGGHIAWVVAAYLLTGTAATPIFGKLSDIFGRRRLLNPALLIFIIASLGCAAATNFAELVALRAIQGIGGAGLMTIAQTAISDVAPPRQRGRYQIYMSGMWGIAAIAGPILGGGLTDLISWRAIFWINLPLGAAALILSNRALAVLPVHDGRGERIDYAGAALLTAAVTCWLVLCTSGGQDFAWWSQTSLLLAAAGAGFTALTAWQERRAPAPMLPPRLFAQATVFGGFLLSAANSFSTFAAAILIPLYFQYVRHGNASASGLFVTPFLLSFVVMSYVGAQISRRSGRAGSTLRAGLVACVVGSVLMATMGPATPLPLCVVYMIILGGGIGLVQPNITVAIQNAAARRDVGIATGCMLLFRAIGGAFGATVAAAMLLRFGFFAGFDAGALVALLALLIAAVMPDTALRGG
jgi:EmrB/QacA subfamily drug resistance transporter